MAQDLFQSELHLFTFLMELWTQTLQEKGKTRGKRDCTLIKDEEKKETEEKRDQRWKRSD
jgi:hypothetical protein